MKTHRTPVPYLGGVAIFLGWAFAVIGAMLLFRGSEEPTGGGSASGPTIDFRTMMGVLLAGLLVTLVGLIDDVRVASPRFKLIGLAAAAILLIGFGIGDDTVLMFFKAVGVGVNIPGWLVTIYSVPLTLLIVAGACNATNLIDGMDGLCSGVLGIMAVGFFALAAHVHLWNGWSSLDAQKVTLSLAMLGAALGFLPYNRNPAKIFMGDAGSLLLGLNAAILMLLFAKTGGIRWMAGSVMVFGLPLADMVLTLARRWRHQKPLMKGDRSHFYDQLVDRGWPVRRVVRISFLMAGGFALAGCAATVLRVRYLLLLYAAVVAVAIYLVHRHQMLRVDDA